MPPARMSRRKLLASLATAGTVGVAGCQGFAGQPSSNDSNGNNATNPNNSTGNAGPNAKQTGGGLPSTSYQAKTVEDFQDISGWKAVSGSIQQTNAPAGKAIRITGSPDAGNQLWVRKRGIDWNLKNKNLSFALDIEKPEIGQNVVVTMRLYAPDADNTMTVGEFVRVLPNQGWLRLDVGAREISGLPKLENVTGVDIMVQPPQGGRTDVRIADIRAVDSFDKGYIALTFDDGLASQIKAHQVMQKHDVPGTMGIITGKVGDEGYLNMNQLEQMKKAGWDFAAHSTGTTPLPQMESAELWQTVIDCHDWMVEHGFEQAKGRSSFIYPRGRWNNQTIRYLERENYFSSGYRYVSYAGSMTGPVTDPWTISRGDGSIGIDYLRPMMNLASLFNEMMILAFHDVGQGDGMSISQNGLEEIIKYAKDRDMEFITLAELERNGMAELV